MYNLFMTFDGFAQAISSYFTSRIIGSSQLVWDALSLESIEDSYENLAFDTLEI